MTGSQIEKVALPLVERIEILKVIEHIDYVWILMIRDKYSFCKTY